MNGNAVDKECPVCKQCFIDIPDLKKHIKSFHRGTDVDLPFVPTRTHQFPCNLCMSSFSKLASLNYHKRIKHNIASELSKARINKCPLCEYSNSKATDIHQHFDEVHNIQLNNVHYKFSTDAEFFAWKTEMEKETKAQFVKGRGIKPTGSIIINYNCHRSGYYVAHGKGLRKLKAQGSRKINAYCPAQIKVSISRDNSLNVLFQEVHVGHDTELRHLCLTNEERELIGKKVAANLSFDQILSDIRDSVTGNSDIERIHLLTRKDLHNILSKTNSAVSSENTADSKEDSCTSGEDSSDEFEQEKIKLIDAFLSAVDKISNRQQLEGVKKLIEPIESAVEALEETDEVTDMIIVYREHDYESSDKLIQKFTTSGTESN